MRPFASVLSQESAGDSRGARPDVFTTDVPEAMFDPKPAAPRAERRSVARRKRFRLPEFLAVTAIACGTPQRPLPSPVTMADSGVGDSGTDDSGPGDSGINDSGPGDSGVADSGIADSGMLDSGMADSGCNGPFLDAGSLDCSCGCGEACSGEACQAVSLGDAGMCECLV